MPGELMGHFYKSKNYLGDININCKFGLFGDYLEKFNTKNIIKILPRNDVKIGPATIVTTLNGEGPKEYACEIQKINSYSQDTTKNIVIKVTDRELLQLTGGIVQGMSGSPIIQDGKIVGAVTHVFVNNPTMGHGIFIENMLLAQERYKQ
jgi:stage IV sporulation protein B